MQRFEYILVLIILILFLVGYFYFRLDDAYIFYNYARNLAEGNGYVFNIGERVNATTSPLYTILLAFFYYVVQLFTSIDIVIIGNLISVFSIVLIFYMMKRIFSDADQFNLFILVFLAMPLLKFAFGMETFLNLSIITCSVYYFLRKKIGLASFFAALSVLARIDSLLFAIILLLYYTVQHKMLPNIKMLVIFFITILPWFVFSKIYFDSFLPTTVEVKVAQSELELFGKGLIFLKESVRVIPGNYLSVFTILVLLIFCILYLYKKRISIFNNVGISIIIIWSFLLFVIYAFIINAMPYQWYYTPYALSISIVISIVFDRTVKNIFTKKAIVVLLFLTAMVLPIKNIIQGYNPKYVNMKNAAEWLNQNAANGSVLGTDDVGIIGFYYNKGKIVDALGLITPEVSTHLKEKDFRWFTSTFKPDYIVNEFPNVQKYVAGDETVFWNNYQSVKIFESRGEKIAIYKRKVNNLF